MDILGVVLFGLVLLIGLGMVPLGLPGTVVIAADALVYSLATHGDRLPLWMVAVLFVLAAAAETADNLLTVAGARRGGTSTQGQWAAFVGGIVGAIALGGVVGPLLALMGLVGGPGVSFFSALVGPVIGAFAGCFVGVWVAESARRREQGDALKAAWATVLGRAVGIGLKLALSVGMVGLSLVAVIRSFNG